MKSRSFSITPKGSGGPPPAEPPPQILAQGSPMTADELKVLNLLGEAWNAFLRLPSQAGEAVFNDDREDFRGAIHDGQRIVLSRWFFR